MLFSLITVIKKSSKITTWRKCFRDETENSYSYVEKKFFQGIN